MRMTDYQSSRLAVLRALRASEPVSRTDLARQAGLSGATITSITGELVNRGIVVEKRATNSLPGRPRMNLSINPEGAFVLGASLTGGGTIAVEIVDLRGRSMFAFSERARLPPRFDDLADQFAAVLERAIEACPIPNARISQVGVSLPAVLDSGVVVEEFLKTLENGANSLARSIEEKLRIPTHVDNAVNVLARAEHWFAADADAKDFTLVLLDLGIGAARYRDSQLVVGSHGTAAELGHVKIVPEGGEACHCGASGCLLAYSSIAGIVVRCHETLGRARPRHVGLRNSLARLLAARASDSRIAEVFARAGRYLGIALANHINMQDPERIVILSHDNGLASAIRSDCQTALENNMLLALRRHTSVTFKCIDPAAFARGAAALVLEDIYMSR